MHMFPPIPIQSLPCQSCVKRGLANVCIYPDPDTEPQQNPPQTPNKRTHTLQTCSSYHSSHFPVTAGQIQVAPGQPSFVQTVPTQPQQAPQLSQSTPQQPGAYYYDYQANNSSFRAAKRPRPLTEDETAAITKNFQRGAFYIGSSQVSF